MGFQKCLSAHSQGAIITYDKFVRQSVGKVGKSGIKNPTLSVGSPEKAIEEITL